MSKDIRTNPTNALRGGRALKIDLEVDTTATPMAVYDTLVDLSSHLEWAGNRAPRGNRLLTLEAPRGPAMVGTEWTSTGADPTGMFTDRSVVTEAIPGRVFEFVTEATQTAKDGDPVVWTVVNRFELAPREAGARISYSERVTSVSRLPGKLRMFGTPLVGLVMKVATRVSRRSVTNLAEVAVERSA